MTVVSARTTEDLLRDWIHAHRILSEMPHDMDGRTQKAIAECERRIVALILDYQYLSQPR